MPPDEDEMYKLVCKDRFDKIDKAIDCIDRKLFGDNNNGLSGRVIRVEGTVKMQESRWKWLIGTSTALCLTIIGKVLYDVIVFLKSIEA